MTSAPFVPLRDPGDTKERYVARLPASALRLLRAYARMVEELEAQQGRAPKRRARQASGPEPATIDHVLTIAITKALATDRAFIAWTKKQQGAAGLSGVLSSDQPTDKDFTS